MKPNYVDPDMMHSHESIAAQNKEINRLYDEILPIAEELVKKGIEQRTAHATREVLAEEVNFLLDSMFTGLDLDRPATTNDDMRDEDIIRADTAKDQAQWIAQLSKDFALAAVAFWLDLGVDCEKAWNPQQQLIGALRTGNVDQELAAFDLLASRFYVGEQGRDLLKVLHERSTDREQVDAVHPPIDAPRIKLPLSTKGRQLG